MYDSQVSSQHAGAFLLVLVTLFLVVFLLFRFYNPEFLQYKNGKCHSGHQDVAKNMLWSLGLTILFLLLLCILWKVFSCAR